MACTFPSCKIPPKLRQLWHKTIKKFCEEEENEIITDWEYVWNFILNKLKEVKKSGFRATLQSVRPWLKERGKIPSPSGRQESAFSGRQMGLVQKENLVVFCIPVSLETERCQRKNWRTQEYLASNQAWVTSEGEKITFRHPLLYRREEDRLTLKAWQV